MLAGNNNNTSTLLLQLTTYIFFTNMTYKLLYVT